MQQYVGAQMLNSLLIRFAFDARKRDCRMFKQHLLDQSRKHFLPTTFEHIFLSIDDAEKTVLIHAGDVAGGQPTISQALRGSARGAIAFAAITTEHLRS